MAIRKATRQHVQPIKKSNTSNMLNTSDNIKDIEDLGHLKHRTMTGKDNKAGIKHSNTVKPENEEELRGNQTKSLQKDEKDHNHEDHNKEDKEVEVKKKKELPICIQHTLKWMKRILDNNVFIAFMTIITIYALFGDDFRVLLWPKSGDEVFYSLTCAALFFFTIEIIMASIAQKDYFLGFYFWLDTVSTLSLLTDIGWLMDAILGGGSVSAANASSASSLARAGRAARIGTRAGRIVRLIRLIRIIKLYKNARNAMDKQKEKKGEDEEISAEELAQIQKKNEPNMNMQESKVGQKLSDLTTRKVIVIVLIMMFSVPLFSLDTYQDDPNSYNYGLEMIALYNGSYLGTGWNYTRDTFITEMSVTRSPILSMNCKNDQYNKPGVSLSDYRTTEVNIGTYSGDDYVAIYDDSQNTKLGAGLSIGRTLFIWLVLTVAAMWFSSTANTLVINPIENMIEKVKKIATNPLEAAQEEENQTLALEKLMEEEKKKNKDKKVVTKEAPYETVILESTIVKIGALLAIGFGEAGSAIISKNMEKSGEVDPMMPGK